MCQESVGDHSTVVKADFERVVEEFSGREAFVGAGACDTSHVGAGAC